MNILPFSQPASLPPLVSLTNGYLMPQMARDGHVLLPGLTPWLARLDPARNSEAWIGLHDPAIEKLVGNIKSERPYFILNDHGDIDPEPIPRISFRVKEMKSHLTLVQGLSGLNDYQQLPRAVADYLISANAFLTEVHAYLTEILPLDSLPVKLMARVFRYAATGNAIPFVGMRPHLDGSVMTLVIAQSDECLLCVDQGRFRPVGRPDGNIFAALMPGMAAWHDLRLRPTPHLVQLNGQARTSLTVFIVPDLGNETLAVARARLSKWNLWVPTRASCSKPNCQQCVSFPACHEMRLREPA